MKTIIKLSFVILFAGFNCLTFSQNKAKTVTLDGLVVKLDEISEEKPLKTIMDKNQGKKKALTNDSLKITHENVPNEISVYTNSDKNSFFMVDSKPVLYVENDFVDIVERNTTISFYNSDGTKLWEKRNNLEMYNSKIENTGKYIFSRSLDPITYESKLWVISNNGEILLEESGIREHYISNNLNAICYEIEGKDTYNIAYFNVCKNIKWVKTFPANQRASIINLSSNGEKIATCIDNKMHIWNNEGVETWSKPYNKYSGFVKLSYDGNYLLWDLILVFGYIEIYDNNIGKLLYKSNQLFDSKEKTLRVDVEFIEGLKEFVIIHFPTDFSTEISIMSIKGEVLKNLLIDKRYNDTFKIQKADSNTISIFLDNTLIRNFEIAW